MADAKQSATQVAADFDRLMGNYKRMTKLLLDGLAPGVPQEKRNELRKLFTPFGTETPARKAKSNDESGNPALE